MRTRRLAAVTVAAAAIALTGISGCGGGAPKDRTAGLAAAEILDRSVAAADSLTAFRLKGGATLEASVAPGGLPDILAQILKAPVKVDGEGPVNAGAISFDFDATLSGLPAIQANITKIDGSLFATLLGVDYRVDLPQDRVASIHPAGIPAGLLSWATAPKEVGREDVDGEPTVHLTATLDPAHVLADAASLIGTLRGSPIGAAELRRSGPQLDAALTKRTLDLWIGTRDLVPRRVAAHLRFAGRVDAIRQLRAATLDLDVSFTQVGKAVQITAPDAKETLDLSRLRSLTG